MIRKTMIHTGFGAAPKLLLLVLSLSTLAWPRQGVASRLEVLEGKPVPIAVEETFTRGLGRWEVNPSCKLEDRGLLLKNGGWAQVNPSERFEDFSAALDFTLHSGGMSWVFALVDEQNYRTVHFSLEKGLYQLIEVKAGVARVVEQCPVDLVAEASYLLEIVSCKAGILVWLDGKNLGHAKQPGERSGGMALRSGKKDVWCASSFRVWGTPSEGGRRITVDSGAGRPGIGTLAPWKPDFTGGLDGWAKVRGAFVENGLVFLEPRAYVESPEESATFDFDLEVEMTVAAMGIGLLFRVQDEENHYLWQVNAQESCLKVHVKKGGTYAVLKSTPMEVPIGEPMRLTISARGGVITTKVGTKVLDTTEDETFTSGRIGFRMGGKERGTIAAVQLRAAGK